MSLWISELSELLETPELACRVTYSNMTNVDLTVMDRFLSLEAHGHWLLTT